MPHTKKELAGLTKKDVYAIAREIANTLDTPQPAISKFPKDKLIGYIIKTQKMITQTVETVETSEVEAQADVVVEADAVVEAQAEEVEIQPEEITLTTPEEFFEEVSNLVSKLDVCRACNELLEKLENKHTSATASKKLTYYRKPFLNYTHENENLNEVVTTKRGSNKQHIAANLLKLSSEQIKELTKKREIAELARKGLTEEGEPDGKIPTQTEILKVIKKSCGLIKSNKYAEIVAGILPLIGVRKNEQNLPFVKENIDGEEVIIHRDWIVVGEYLIAIRGLSKKKGDNSWWIRPTLIPAELILKAHQKYLSLPEIKTAIKKIDGDQIKFTNHGITSQISRTFKRVWAEEFSTILSYDKDNKRKGNDASPHKARAFYVWALFPVLKANGFTKLKQIKLYIQNCLAHEDSKDTEKYFDRYDEEQFIEAVNVDIPLKTSEVGLTSEERVLELAEEWEEEKLLQKRENEEIKQGKQETLTEQQLTNLEASISEQKPKEDCISLAQFIEAIPTDLQVKLSEFLAEEKDPTKAVVKLLNTTYLELKKEIAPTPKKVDLVENNIKEIIGGIFQYNSAQAEVRLCVYPSYNLVNRIYKKLIDKQVGRSVFDRIIEEFDQDITERLTSRGIGEKQNNNHRKTMEQVIDKIIGYVDLTFESDN